MFAIERQQAILKLLEENGKVTVSELMILFDVSAETLRKDLLILEKSKLLVRTHGGAVRNVTHSVLTPLPQRKQENPSKKDELCRTAISFINEGDTIAIDSGSTAVFLAKAIADSFSRLTVVTHSSEVFSILSSNDNIKIMLMGGNYNHAEKAFTGIITTETVEKIHTEKMLLFPSAISLKYGITEYGEEFLRIQKSYMKNTDRIFILADSDKFEKSAYLKLDDINPDYTYITDSGLSDEIYNLYQKNNINIIRSNKK